MTSIVRRRALTDEMPATYRPSHFTRNLKFLYGSLRWGLTLNSGMAPPLIPGRFQADSARSARGVHQARWETPPDGPVVCPSLCVTLRARHAPLQGAARPVDVRGGHAPGRGGAPLRPGDLAR